MLPWYREVETLQWSRAWISLQSDSPAHGDCVSGRGKVRLALNVKQQPKNDIRDALNECILSPKAESGVWLAYVVPLGSSTWKTTGEQERGGAPWRRCSRPFGDQHHGERPGSRALLLCTRREQWEQVWGLQVGWGGGRTLRHTVVLILLAEQKMGTDLCGNFFFFNSPQGNYVHV